jgi:tetratricopeptide (TPR) repeat protein
MVRNIIVLVLVVAVIGALGTTAFIYYQRKLHDDALEKMHMGEAFINNEKYDDAIKALLPVVQKGKGFDESAKALSLLIKAYDGAGHKEADELRRKLVTEYPDSPDVPMIKIHLANSLIESDPAESRKIFQEAIGIANDTLKDFAELGIAKSYDLEGKWDEAKEIYYSLIDSATEFSIISVAKDRLSEVNTQRLWSPTLDDFTLLHTVERGQAAITIGQKYKTTAWFVTEANKVKANRLQPGMRLKVPKEPFHIIVNKAQCRMDLRSESGEFIKWYKVGVGEESYKTPADEYSIETKEINPRWYNRREGREVPPLDPENALGVRWMGIGNHLGIHGTNQPETIGYAKSAGCIRMHNHEVEELYKLVTYGTRVTIIEGTEPYQIDEPKDS